MPSKKIVKKPAAKKPAGKKVAVKKIVVKKPVVNKAAVKKTAAKKVVIKKPVGKKVAVKKAAVKKPVGKKTPAKKLPGKILAAKKSTAKKPVVKKSAAKKPAGKPAGKAAAVKRSTGKTVTAKKSKSAAASSAKVPVTRKSLLEARAKGQSIEDMISQRDIEQKSVEDFIGSPQQKQDMSKKPIIPGLYDLLIPPGTPRMLIIKLAKQYNLQMVRRDDIYVPVGVSDVERDLLAIRGDKKSIKKLEKVLFQEIENFINSKDARRHDYSKKIRLEGIGEYVPAKKAKA